ncbi:ribose 5-phosphate isomerase B [bacterium]|nr:ribose 5-phosphate isomerase B [bacterium]
MKKLITERKVIEQAKRSKEFEITGDEIITALARDKAKQLGIVFKKSSPKAPENSATSGSLKAGAEKKVAIGADHGGFALKEFLKKVLKDSGYTIVDVGTNSTQSVDYPDFAHAVAQLVSDGDCFRGIMIDGAGIGSCMAANKVPNVRAAMCYDISSAVNSREHNNANVLTLGGKMIGELVAEHIVKVWMKTEYAGGRHQARIDKINAIEKKYLK